MFPKELAADPLVFCYPQGRASCQTRQRPVLMYEGEGSSPDLVTRFQGVPHQCNVASVMRGVSRFGASE